MKMLSAANAKSGTSSWHLRPREGTKLRMLYDAFMENKGIVINEPITMKYGRGGFAVSQLRDVYGLDIRRISGRNKAWVLAGEWFGNVYVDYIAARLKIR